MLAWGTAVGPVRFVVGSQLVPGPRDPGSAGTRLCLAIGGAAHGEVVTNAYTTLCFCLLVGKILISFVFFFSVVSSFSFCSMLYLY